MSSANDPLLDLDVLASEYVERLRRGEDPSVSGYASAHPALASQIRSSIFTHVD